MTVTSHMFKRCAATLVLVGIAVVLRLPIEAVTGAELPEFITFYPVIMVAALTMGLCSGLLATAACLLMADYFVITPARLGHWGAGEAVSMALFCGLGIAVSLFAEHYRRMQQKLKVLVAERTSELEHKKAELNESLKKERDERSLMDAVMEALPTGVAITDASGGTIRVNSTFNSLWGEQRPAAASVEDYEEYQAWWGDTDRPVLSGEWASARAIRGETVVGQVLRIRRFDGTEVFVINSASPVYDADGVVAGSVVAIQDVSELKKVEEELRNNEERLRLAFQAANAGAWEWNVETNALIWSDELWSVLDIEPHSCEPTYELWLKTIHPADCGRVNHVAREAARHGRELVVEWRVKGDDDADERWLMSLGKPQRAADGSLKRYIGIVLDISQRKLAEKKLQDRDFLLQVAYNQLQLTNLKLEAQSGDLMARNKELDGLYRIVKESEERLRFHIENSPMAVIEWDSDMIINLWTGESERLFGWSAGEVTGKPINSFNMIFEDDLPLVQEIITSLIDGESRHIVCTNRNYTKSGEVRHCIWYNTVLPDEQGRMKSVMSNVVDITDRVTAEQRLNLLAETASLLLVSDSPQDVVETLCEKAMPALGCQLFFNFLVDDRQNRLHLNACAGIPAEARHDIEWLDYGVAVCGCAARDACRIVAEDISHGDDPRTNLVKSFGVTAYACHPLMAQDRVLGTLSFGSRTKTSFSDDDLALMKAVADQVAIAMERMQTAQALYQSNEELEQRVVERTQELASTINQLKDEIKERMRTEKRRLEAEQTLREETLQRLQAVEAMRRQEHIMIQQNRQAAMGEMIGNIAHQWRQPLNTLGLLTQRIGYFHGSPQFNKEFVDTSVAKAMDIINYMSRTIDDFRTFFAADREKTDFRVDETVSKVLSLVEASFKDKRIRLEREEDEQVVITGYPNEYAQVLLNILINAKDAMNERAIESPWLKISTSCKNGVSCVAIADNAGGISEEIIDKIFDPYFTTKGPQQGTGIGLFMAKAIIETNMGGRLSVRNTGEGAEFVIEV